MREYPTQDSEDRGYYDQPKAFMVDDVRPAVPVPEQEKAIDELRATVDVLSDRLSSVLGPDYPSESAEVRALDTARPDASPLRSKLDNNNDLIRRTTRRLSNLIERLEV